MSIYSDTYPLNVALGTGYTVQYVSLLASDTDVCGSACATCLFIHVFVFVCVFEFVCVCV